MYPLLGTLHSALYRVVALLVANKNTQLDPLVVPPWQKTININSMTNADVQIQRIEHEKSQTLAELEYALKRQAGLQVVMPCNHICIK